MHLVRVHSTNIDDQILSLKCTRKIKKYMAIEHNLNTYCPCQIMEENMEAIEATLMATSLHRDFSNHFFVN